MLIAEDLLLLVTDDSSGRLVAAPLQVDLGLGGALLVDLVLAGNVDLSGKGEKITVTNRSTTGEDLLDGALRIAVDHQGQAVSKVIKPLSKHVRTAIYEQLTAKGLVHAEQGKILGLFPTHRWPSDDANHEARVRHLINEALINGASPSPATASLIALLHAMKCLDKVFRPKQLGTSKQELQTRAEQISQGGWASEAVQEAIKKAIAASAAAVAAAATSAVVLSGAQ